MTSEIAQCIQLHLNPKGVAVHISAEHQCMSSRGVHKLNVDMITTHFTGEFNENSEVKKTHARNGQNEYRINHELMAQGLILKKS